MHSVNPRRPIVVLAALAVFSNSPFALLLVQEDVAVEASLTLPDARTVMKRFAEVTRVDGVIAKTEFRQYVGDFDMPSFGIKGSFNAWQGKPNRYVTEVDLGAQVGIIRQGTDGKVGWSSRPMLGDRILAGGELLTPEIAALFDGYLRPESFFESMETVAKEAFDGVECFKVKVVAKPLEGMEREATLKT